jgi:demethylmenaquinone methyltransferase/2-methoxy-6-polyprenyl-1,4-benzoquinol methylase
MCEIKDFFNSKAASWDSEIVIHADRIEYLISLLDLQPFDRVLDVVCGTGVLEDFLSNDIRLMAIDFSQGMIDEARRKHPNVNYVVDDFLTMKTSAMCYDKIIMHNVFPHFLQPVFAVKKAYELLAPNGILLICHSIGRSVINQRHSSKNNRLSVSLPLVKELAQEVEHHGFKVLQAEDENDYYALKVQKTI